MSVQLAFIMLIVEVKQSLSFLEILEFEFSLHFQAVLK